MNDVAGIAMEKIMLKENLFLFLPKSVLLGSFDERGKFIDATKEEVPQIDRYHDVLFNTSYYVGFPVEVKALQEVYKDVSEFSRQLKLYFNELNNYIFLVSTDPKTKEVQIHNVYIGEMMPSRILPRDSFDSIDELLNINDLKLLKQKLLFHLLQKGSKEKDSSMEERKDSLPKTSSVLAKRIPIDIDLFDFEDYLKKRMIGQEEAICVLAPTIRKNFLATRHEQMKYCLSVGQTGTGKTLFYELLREYLKEQGYSVPIVVYSTNNLTQSGYIGDKITTILKELITLADRDLTKAQNGIIVLDEFDKIAQRGSMVADEAVQHALLKLYDGATYEVELSPGKTVLFDTSLLQIAAVGAFSNYTSKKNVGFHQDQEETKVNNYAIENYGFSKELIARIHRLVSFQPMSEEVGLKLLKESVISPMQQIIQFMKEVYHVDVFVSDGLYHCIVQNAIRKGQNARGFRNRIEELFEIADREIQLFGPVEEGSLFVSEETFYDNRKYQLKLEKKFAIMKSVK